MGADGDTTALRRTVLAVAVLDDVDVEPHPHGAVVPGARGPVLVPWPALAAATGDHPRGSPLARLRTATLLRVAALLDRLPDADDPDHVDGWPARHVRALALPPGHPLHPGPGWAFERVRGGALDVGLGLVDLPWRVDRPGSSLPLPLPVAPQTAAPSATWWPAARAHAHRMGTLAAARVGPASPGRPGTLRPVGGCDVLTLLTTPALRAALAGGDGSGLRAVAVPTRSRGWFDLRRVDPAFVAAAWSATDEPERGLPRALLVTRDEVVLPRQHAPSRSLSGSDPPPR